MSRLRKIKPPIKRPIAIADAIKIAFPSSTLV